jgi:hypothetical protein
MITVDITTREPRGASQVYIEYHVTGPGWTADENLLANVDNVSPAQGVTQLRTKVINFCADVKGLVVAAKDVWIFGAPQ